MNQFIKAVNINFDPFKYFNNSAYQVALSDDKF